MKKKSTYQKMKHFMTKDVEYPFVSTGNMTPMVYFEIKENLRVTYERMGNFQQKYPQYDIDVVVNRNPNQEIQSLSISPMFKKDDIKGFHYLAEWNMEEMMNVLNEFIDNYLTS